ncbi:MAG: ribosomal protein S18-alanine N-acetyltransferase [Oscillospiraceae bacterium]|nr:ribosomal protein S18-alanine N-acetyltransferase [Oscillospiraceae bacterium]
MMEIVRMNEAHIAQIEELERCCFSDPWSRAMLEPELSNPLSLWLVAVCDGQVVGYVGSQSVLDGADMMNIAVHPQYRKQGIAQRLIKELISLLQDRGVKCLALEVRASNKPAICLYQKLGFVQVGCRPGYYRNPKEDAFILRKEWS